MDAIGNVEQAKDEDGDAIAADRGGLPDDRKLARAVRRLDHPDTTPEQREKYIKWLKRATRAMLQESGALSPPTPDFAAGDWIASTIGIRDGVPRSVAICVLIHGAEVIGWETSGANDGGAIEFESIRRTSGKHWVKAASVNPAIVAAAQAQGLIP